MTRKAIQIDRQPVTPATLKLVAAGIGNEPGEPQIPDPQAPF